MWRPKTGGHKRDPSALRPRNTARTVNPLLAKWIVAIESHWTHNQLLTAMRELGLMSPTLPAAATAVSRPAPACQRAPFLPHRRNDPKPAKRASRGKRHGRGRANDVTLACGLVRVGLGHHFRPMAVGFPRTQHPVRGCIVPATHAAVPISVAAARSALDAATDVTSVAMLVDRLEVIRLAARKVKASHEAQNDWATLKLEAERKAGRMPLICGAMGPRAGRPSRSV